MTDQSDDPRQLVLRLEEPFSNSSVAVAHVESILLAGLRWRSDYWTGLALEWIDQGAPISESVVSEIELVSADKSLRQAIRHEAFAIATRWHRETKQAEQVSGGNGGQAR